MSGGGGKSTTTETTVPNWIRDPAARNLQRAEQVQQLEYMPYHGGQVAAFNENQTQAMQNNANAATAFGLLAPTDVMGSMPTPTTYANGMKGYGSIGLYDQALADLTASNPDNMAAYNSLFGNDIAPINFGRQGGGGGGRGGGGNYNPTRTTKQVDDTTPYDYSRHQKGVDQAKAIDAKYAIAPYGVEPGTKYQPQPGIGTKVQTSPIRWYDKNRKQPGVGGKYGFGL